MSNNLFTLGTFTIDIPQVVDNANVNSNNNNVIESNGNYPVPSGKTGWNSFSVNIPQSQQINVQSNKEQTISENHSITTITPTTGYDAMERVTVTVDVPESGSDPYLYDGELDISPSDNHKTVGTVMTEQLIDAQGLSPDCTLNVNGGSQSINLLEDHTFTQNGTYTVPNGYDGYGRLSVQVGNLININKIQWWYYNSGDYVSTSFNINEQEMNYLVNGNSRSISINIPVSWNADTKVKYILYYFVNTVNNTINFGYLEASSDTYDPEDYENVTRHYSFNLSNQTGYTLWYKELDHPVELLRGIQLFQNNNYITEIAGGSGGVEEQPEWTETITIGSTNTTPRTGPNYYYKLSTDYFTIKNNIS